MPAHRAVGDTAQQLPMDRKGYLRWRTELKFIMQKSQATFLKPVDTMRQMIEDGEIPADEKGIEP